MESLSNEELQFLMLAVQKVDPTGIMAVSQQAMAKLQQEARKRMEAHTPETPQENGTEPETATAGW